MSRLLGGSVAIVLLLASLSSCTIFRKGSRKDKIQDTTAVTNRMDPTVADSSYAAARLNEARQKYIASFTPLLQRQINYTSFTGKAKMHYEGKGQKQEFTSHFRIIKDKVIWVSVTAIGGIVQVARVYITPDSMKLINYLDKEVTIMPLAEAGKVLPVPADFSTLQNLIIGNVLRSSGTITDAADMGSILSIQVEEGNVVQQITYNKADTTLRSLQMRSTGGALATGLIQYANYGKVSNRSFSMDRTVNVISGGEQYYLDMNFANPSFDQPVEVPFSIPKNYKIK